MSMGPPESLRVGTTGAACNLAAALLNLLNPSGALAEYTQNFLRWLERSGVDEASFDDCIKAAWGLAYQNSNGMVLFDGVAQADLRLQKLTKAQQLLPLTFSKALGRHIVKEPEVSYMASTTACLLTHHDSDYVKSALTSMILDKGGHEKEVQFKHEALRAPMRAVIAKLVDSIFLNLSNAGHRTTDLPEELAHLHVHVLDGANFAAIVMQVQKTTKDLFLRADRFPGDIILWLLNHFEGHLEI